MGPKTLLGCNLVRISSLVESRWFPLVFVAILAVVPLFTNNYFQFIFNLILCYVLIGFGQNLILGYTGQFSFANAAFMGIGAYTTSIVFTLNVPILFALLSGGLLAAVVACVVGLPALRLSRVYLALATIAFGEMTTWVLMHWTSVTKGGDGMYSPVPVIFGYALKTDAQKYFLTATICVLMVVLAQRILSSKFGRAFIAIRESETVASCNGINIPLYKTIAFALSGLYAGIGGGLYAIAVNYIVPDNYDLFQLVIHFALVMVGGLGSMYGVIVGALILTALPELLREFKHYQEMLYGVLLILFIVFIPRGVGGFLKDLRILPREILVHGWRREIPHVQEAAKTAAVFNVGAGAEDRGAET